MDAFHIRILYTEFSPAQNDQQSYQSVCLTSMNVKVEPERHGASATSQLKPVLEDTCPVSSPYEVSLRPSRWIS